MKNIGPYLIKEQKELFKNNTYLSQSDFRKFKNNFLKLNALEHVSLKKNDSFFGFKKGSKQALWRFDMENDELWSDLKDKDIYSLALGRLETDPFTR